MTSSVASELGRLRSASSWRRWSLVIGVAGLGGIVVAVAVAFGPVSGAIAVLFAMTWLGVAVRWAVEDARSWRRVHDLARAGGSSGRAASSSASPDRPRHPTTHCRS